VVVEEPESGMPDAKVILRNKAMGFQRIMVTSMDGMFEATGLPPAAGYRISVSHERFLDWESHEFSVPAGERLSFDIVLVKQDSGANRASSGRIRPAQHTTRPVGNSVEGFELDLLPAPRRRWDSLALLAPVVTTGQPGTLAIRGVTSSNAYFVDGLLANNTYSARTSESAVRVSQEAVQGMQVMSGADTPELGHAMGGTVNTVTRSGGAALHGGLYEYFSNAGWNAIDRYALGRNLFRKSNQPGFHLGGPVPGTPLHFYSNLEVSDAQGRAMNRITNPLIADSTGATIASSNCKASAAQCAGAIQFIGSQMNRLVPQSEHSLDGLTRLDYRANDRNSFSFSVHGSHSRSPFGSSIGAVSSDGGLLGGALLKSDSHSARAAWLSMPGLSSENELRLGYFHDRLATTTSSTDLATGNVGISIAGATVGETNPNASVRRERRTQLVDNLRASAGAHTALLGIDWTRTRDWTGSLVDSTGAYIYPSLTAFALDLAGAGQKNYTGFRQTFGNPVRNLHSTEIGFYVQDSWLAAPRLRVTAGVRWSKPYIPQPTEANSYYWQTGSVNSPNINADPRIGFSFLLDDSTVLRASFGMFHASHSGELIDALFLGNGVYQSGIQVNPAQTGSPAFPNALTSSTIPKGALDILYASNKLRAPYNKQTTLTLERHIGHGATLSASYLSSAGVKLWTVEDLNLGSTSTAVYSVADGNGKNTGTLTLPVWTARSSSDYGHVYQVNNGGSSWYHALAIQFRKRMAHGFAAGASYTWSHAIDDVGGTLVTGGLPLSYGNTDHLLDKGSSATDQRHRAVIAWSWQPTLRRDPRFPVHRILNGWELSAITTLASGQPQTALVVVNGQQFAKTSMAFYGSLNGSGGWSRSPLSAVNSLYSEPAYVVNLRLARRIPFSERIVGKLSFEALNAFNTQYDTSVRTLAYTAANGILTPVSGTGTGTAAAGYAYGSNARTCRAALRIDF
jgi:hypothetical protein